jgi:RNA polymerase sigma-70 factor (sigma-E family)
MDEDSQLGSTWPAPATAAAARSATTASRRALGASHQQPFGSLNGIFFAPDPADQAVIALYGEYFTSLVRLAMLLVRDTATAEEVVQDAFIAMHRGWHRLRDEEHALAYLRQAVLNRARSVLRHRAIVDRNMPKPPPGIPSAEDGAISMFERSAVVAALRELPDRQREALVLRYYGDLSEAEIAAAMGITRGAVKSHTARAMTALRAALREGLLPRQAVPRRASCSRMSTCWWFMFMPGSGRDGLMISWPRRRSTHGHR